MPDLLFQQTLPPEREFLPPPVDRDWLVARLSQIGQSQAALARHLGLGPAAVSLLLAGRRSARAAEVTQIAQFLGVSVDTVLDKLGAAAPASAPPATPVLAFLAAGDVVEPVDLSQHPGPFTAPRTPDLAEAEAIAVVSSHAAPRYYPGDFIYFSRVNPPPPDTLIGRAVVGETADGRLFVKRLAAGSRPDTYTLLSYSPTIDPEIDQSLAWVAPVAWVRPA